MELRSTSRKEFQSTLMALGLYEDGMKLNEMKQIIQALEESQLKCETVFFETDFERELKKNEASPEIPSERFVVEAVVHHDLNWSPPLLEHECEQCLLKHHTNFKNNHIEKRKLTEIEDVACNIKRSRPPITSSPKTFNSDSGTSFVWQAHDQEQVSEVYYSDPSF